MLLKEGPVERPVRLYRDEWGIPHIRAHSTRDAFVGQGYVHAMDRFWQMDASRKQMEGRWAEWVGPAGLPADRLARRLRAAAASIRDYEALGPEAKAMVDAYTAGVNAWLATHQAPVEYDLLGLGAAPEPWEPWHCVASMRQRGYLMGSIWFKLWRAAALPVVGAENVAKLRYDDDGGDRLCIPPGADAGRWVASLEDLQEPIQALSLLASGADTDGGSNNWALAPSRTTTGRPLLAGDPHRVFELPGMYAQLHLACDEFDAIGFTIPGVPAFPHFGHNANVAWCVTHAFADIHDLYVEQFDQADPSRYLHHGNWLTATTTTENIKVKGAQTASVDITETIHGPVIAGDPASGSALTLKSVQFFDLDRSLDCLLPMLRADSVDSLFARRARLGRDRPQPGRRRYRRSHRPPRPGQGPAPARRQRLAASTGLDRRLRVGRHDSRPSRCRAPTTRPAATWSRRTTAWSRPSLAPATTSAPTPIPRTGPSG